MDRALDTALRRLEDLWTGISPPLQRVLSSIELWHVGLFLVGLWLLVKLTGTRLHGR